MIGTAAAALVGGATVAGYLNAKFHLQKDISNLVTVKSAERQYANASMIIIYSRDCNPHTHQSLVSQNQGNPWFVLLQTVKKYPDMICLWTRERSYTYQELQDQACQYAHFYLSQLSLIHI